MRQLVEKRKVTLKSSWMEESDQFMVSRPSPPQSERPKCPACDIPLRTSPDGALSCWICEKKYDPAQLKAGQVQKAPDRVRPKDVTVGKGNDDVEYDDDVDFELDVTNEVEVDDEAEGPPAPDDGIEEVDGPDDEGAEMTGQDPKDEEGLEFVLDEETPSEDEEVQVQVADDEDDEVGDVVEGATNKAPEQVDEAASEDEEMDFELSDEEAEEDWSEVEVGRVDKEAPSEGEEGTEGGTGASEEDDGSDFELELGQEDMTIDDEGHEDRPGTEGEKDGVHPQRLRIRKRFVDQAEVEFD